MLTSMTLMTYRDPLTATPVGSGSTGREHAAGRAIARFGSQSSTAHAEQIGGRAM